MSLYYSYQQYGLDIFYRKQEKNLNPLNSLSFSVAQDIISFIVKAYAYHDDQDLFLVSLVKPILYEWAKAVHIWVMETNVELQSEWPVYGVQIVYDSI